MDQGFVYLDEVVPDLLWNAAYAGCDNFVGHPIDGYLTNRIVGTIEMAQALCLAQKAAQNDGMRLFVFDAYRPTKAVAHFMRWIQEPEDHLTKARHYPNIDKTQLLKLGYIASRSGHSRGSTVDLTLVDADAIPVDMGGIFDLMDEQSSHGYAHISIDQTKNRERLKKIMADAGFDDYRCEWWHYRLINEPHPNRYFDFEIK